MSEDDLSFQICGRSEDSEPLREDRNAILKGLLGFNENKTSLVPDYIWVFMRDRKNRVVGGY